MPVGNHFIQVFRVAARGLNGQRAAIGAATENIANAGVSRTANGESYKIKRAVQRAETASESRFAKTLSRFRMNTTRTDSAHLPQPAGPSSNTPLFEAGPTTEIQETEKMRMEFDPSHPDADENGYVQYPDVNVVEEMASIVSANRLYEANLASVQAAREMIKRTIDI